jgi:uncharacterized protein
MNDFEEFFDIGSDILLHETFQSQKQFVQHGTISVYDHAISVAYKAYTLCKKRKCETRAVVRAGLLHDFFLYDWHLEGKRKKKRGLRKHGFTHAKKALDNAMRLFDLSHKEKDAILKHMFPLNLTPPKYKESWIVHLADDMISIKEVFTKKIKKGHSIHQYIESRVESHYIKKEKQSLLS